jgi:hypothetical protein
MCLLGGLRLIRLRLEPSSRPAMLFFEAARISVKVQSVLEMKGSKKGFDAHERQQMQEKQQNTLRQMVDMRIIEAFS